MDELRVRAHAKPRGNRQGCVNHLPAARPLYWTHLSFSFKYRTISPNLFQTLNVCSSFRNLEALLQHTKSIPSISIYLSFFLILVFRKYWTSRYLRSIIFFCHDCQGFLSRAVRFICRWFLAGRASRLTKPRSNQRLCASFGSAEAPKQESWILLMVWTILSTR